MLCSGIMFFPALSAKENLSGPESLSSDSSKHKIVQLDEVSVTGTRTETDVRNLPMSITRIGHTQIETRFEQSLLPIIAEQVPGLFISSRGIMGYGVSTGAAGNITVRGVGGSPTTGVLVLIDGHPQYMGLMGHPLADSYQSMMAEKVEVIRGPASVLYGSNALGGVINIITRKEEEGIRSGVYLLYGSYNTLTSEINTSVKKGRYSGYLSLDYNRTDGHRDNMDFDEFSGYMKLGYDISSAWKTSVDLNVNQSESSNPGPVYEPITDNDADVLRGMTSFALENKYKQTSGAVKLFYNFGAHKINDGYRPELGETPLDNRFRSNDDLFGVSVYQSCGFFKGNQTTAGFDLQRSGGHAWNKMPAGSPKEELANEKITDAAGYISLQQYMTDKLILNGGVRLDYNSKAGTEWVPQGGISYKISGTGTLKAMVSKGFRNPTIRELYMFQPKNPDLKSERLMNYEISAMQDFLRHALNLGISVFYLKGSNNIQLTPVDGRMQYTNTGEIENCGVELDARYALTRNLSFSANYSFLHMEHKVLVSPENKVYIGAIYSDKRWMAATGLQYVNGLYTVIPPAEEKESFLLWNARVSYKPSKIVEIMVKGENLLAQNYEINKGYPMPRATVFTGVNVTF